MNQFHANNHDDDNHRDAKKLVKKKFNAWMTRQQILELFSHKLNRLRFLGAFAFLPWLAFLSQGVNKLSDGAGIEIGVSVKKGNCEKIEKVFKAKIAKTKESRAHGLSERREPLQEDEAMAFLFDPAQPVSFWMKNTYIPIEIAFFSLNGHLENILQMPVEPNPDQPIKQYDSKGLAAIVLELAPHSLETYLKEKKVKFLQLCAKADQL